MVFILSKTIAFLFLPSNLLLLLAVAGAVLLATRRPAHGHRRHRSAAAYEWIGLIAYRLTGRTGELFPSHS